MVKLDVSNDIGPLDSIVGNDAGISELIAALLLEDDKLIFDVPNSVVDLINLVKNSLSGHEPSTIVDDQRAASLVLVSSGLETTPDLHVELGDVDRLGCVKEAWTMSKLE